VLGSAFAAGTDAVVVVARDLAGRSPLVLAVPGPVDGVDLGAPVRGVDSVELLANVVDVFLAFACVEPLHPAKATRSAAGTHAAAQRRVGIRS
jgi:hypothetical protein